jgi:hypothetical protein
MLLRSSTTLLEVMTTCIQDGPHCGRKGTKQCQSSQIFSIPCIPRWVSMILRKIVLKYHGVWHRYIHIEMEFMDISSLGVAYRYVVKIKKNLKQKMRQFG